MSIKNFTALLAAAMLEIACTNIPPVQVNSITERNPTEYVFDASYAAVLSLIDALCSKDRLPSKFDTPTSKQVYGCDRWSESKAARPAAPPRFYYTPNYYPNASYDRIGLFTKAFDSRSYTANGQPLKVSVQLEMELHRMGEQKTKVSIRAVDLEAFNGRITAMHGGTARHVEHLPSTSIEEYEVLLYLGAFLGQKGMPPIALP